jgi:peptidoglycan/LPS O-acetylase OafA/YrhL
MSMERKDRHEFVRLHFLDTLRGVAACYIVIFHLAFVPPTEMAVPSWLTGFVTTGMTAVTLFFVISAFALCYSASKRGGSGAEAFGKAGNGSLSAFYLRRLFRIAPLFYAMLIFYALLTTVSSGTPPASLHLLINATFLFNLFPDQLEGIVPASWTIGVEMIFYLVFPFLYTRARNIRRATALFVISALLAGLWGYYLETYAVTSGFIDAAQLSGMQQFSFLNHLPAFTLGILAYRIFVFLQVAFTDRQKTLSGLAALGIFLVMYLGLLAGFFGYGWTLLICKPLAYMCLLLGLGLLPVRAVVNRATVALGKMSFSLYLLHPILLFLMAPLFRRIYDTVPQIALAFLLCAMATLALLTGLAWVSYRLVEKTGMRLGEWLLERRQAERIARNQAALRTQ